MRTAANHHEMAYSFMFLETDDREFGWVKIDARWDVARV
jgi:hypothetical protein